MSNRYHLTQQELGELEYEHRHTSDKRYADRIKGVYLLGSGWPVGRVAQALMIDREKCAQPSQALPQRRTDGLAAQ